MNNPLSELAGWWQDAYEDGGEGETLVLYEHRLLGDDQEAHRLEFRTYDDAGVQASWRLSVEDCKQFTWDESGGEVAWFADHPLLLSHEPRTARISFAKPFDDPLRIWGAAAKVHSDLVKGWFPLGRYFRECMVEERFGILAEGPARLVTAYADALLTIGADVGLSTGEIHIAYNAEAPPLSVVTWGHSYFVAHSFRLERIG